jgi:UDP-N-acetylglucosamine 2-epimerase (non-hydrolysing)
VLRDDGPSRWDDAKPSRNEVRYAVVVVSARPNFPKVAPLLRAFDAAGTEMLLVHTGQHYDDGLSASFIQSLGMPGPDINLRVAPGSRDEQEARTIEGMRKIFARRRPDALVVPGDVRNNFAAALAGFQLGVPVAHVEAGLRLFDSRESEERNRLAIDRESAWLFTPSPDASALLRGEQRPEERIHLVGNVMIDSLFATRDPSRDADVLRLYGVKPREYALMTLHRSSNVDDPVALRRIFEAVDQVQKKLPVLFLVHPSTAYNLTAFGMSSELSRMPRLLQSGPAPYTDMQALIANSDFVLADSAGLQEETSALGVPCLTLRQFTERPFTVMYGTSTIVGSDVDRIMAAVEAVRGAPRRESPLPLWDGHAAKRIVQVLTGRDLGAPPIDLSGLGPEAAEGTMAIRGPSAYVDERGGRWTGERISYMYPERTFGQPLPRT